jgi:hypothetical protein
VIPRRRRPDRLLLDAIVVLGAVVTLAPVALALFLL